MPTISGRTTVVKATSSQNVLLGSQYELAPFHGKMEVGIMANLAGQQVSIFAGPDTLQEPGGMCPFAGSEAAPKSPDDYHWEDMVAKGDRLKIIFTNTSGTTDSIINWAVRLTPMA